MKAHTIKLTNKKFVVDCEFNSQDGHILEWDKMSRTEQIEVLDSLSQTYHYFKKHLKDH